MRYRRRVDGSPIASGVVDGTAIATAETAATLVTLAGALEAAFILRVIAG